MLHTRPEPREEEATLVAADPAAPTISRRGVLGFAGAGALLLLVANAGQSLGGPLRRVAFLAPRRQPTGSGSADFPVNKTAASAGVTRAMTGPGWQLELRAGGRSVRLDRAPSCWRCRSARRGCRSPASRAGRPSRSGPACRSPRSPAPAGAGPDAGAYVRSLQPGGVFAHASLNAAQVHADDALLALRVNGADLPLDHGYPARVIVPALPGVHNTKWVARIDFA